jgi:hypothetical protein
MRSYGRRRMAGKKMRQPSQKFASPGCWLAVSIRTNNRSYLLQAPSSDAQTLPALGDSIFNGPTSMHNMSSRLLSVRERSGLSLRHFVETLEAHTGVSFAHDSARRYERRSSRIPATYVGCVCRVFDVNPGWLLFGIGPRTPRPLSSIERAFTEIARVVHRVEDAGDACSDRRGNNGRASSGRSSRGR